MNILMINDCAYVAKNLCDAINHYSNKQHSCQHIFTPLRRGSYLIHTFRYLKFCWQLRKISKQCDFVIIHFTRHGLLSLFCQTKVLVHCHGDDVRNLATYPLYIQWMVKIGLKKAIKIFYSTPDLKAELYDYTEKTVFIPSSININTENEHPTPSQRDGITIMFISKLENLKGMQVIPEILSHCLKDDRITKIMLLNFGLDQQQMIIDDHPKIQKLPIMSKEEYLNKIKVCDIAIGQFSPCGSFGVSELDAMSCSKPLICRFIFDDAYPTPPPFNHAENSQEAINHIDKLLSMTPERRKQYGEKNFLWVKNYHAQEVVYQQFMTHLTDL